MAKRRTLQTVSVMAAPGSSPGVVPAIHVFRAASRKKGVDARNECGHDEPAKLALRLFPLLAVLGFAAAPAEAQSFADFYRGKTITMAVGTSPGGDYDLRMRMVARYIGRHIPGNPTIIATNMPGAGQMLVANWLASVAPKDGTVIVALSQNLPVSQATGATGVKYDVRQFNWIGNTTDSPNVINSWHTTGIRTIQDVMQRELVLGATGSRAAPISIHTRLTRSSAPNSRSSSVIRAATTSTSRWNAARLAVAARIPGPPGSRRGRSGSPTKRCTSWSR